MPLSGGSHRWISEGLDRSFAPPAGTRPPVWLDDDTLLATAEDRGETHLYRLAVDGNAEPERLTSGAGHGADVRRRRRPHRHGPVRPSSTRARSSRSTDPSRSVTRSFLGWERFAVPTTDGTGEIDAWIMRPEGFEPRRKYPVLLNVHGGPFTQYGETFFDEAQMQAAAGFVVRDVATRAAAAAGTRHGARRSSAPSTR